MELKIKRKTKIKIKFIFAWYDLWVGLFWDRNNKYLYIFILPTIGIVLKFEQTEIDWDNINQPWNLRK